MNHQDFDPSLRLRGGGGREGVLVGVVISVEEEEEEYREGRGWETEDVIKSTTITYIHIHYSYITYRERWRDNSIPKRLLRLPTYHKSA